MVSIDDFSGLLSAARLNVENSMVAFDMLMEMSTMVPDGDGWPSASRGTILAVSF